MTWLVPAAGLARDRLGAAIGELAGLCGAPRFAPHITLTAPVDGDPGAVADVLGQLMTGTPAFDIELAGPDCEPRFYQALYLHVRPSPQISALHEAACRAWGIPAEPYRPHLSLLYSGLPAARKQEAMAGISLALPMTIRISAAELWADFREPPAAWRRAAEVKLA